MDHTVTKPVVREFQPSQGTILTYCIGFVGSLALTMTAYLAVTNHKLSGNSLLNFVIALALTQFVLQVVCFLHLGRKSSQRWNLIAFLFMIMVVVMIVFGSIWIMNNLDYNMHSSANLDKEIMQDEAINK